MSYGLRFKKKSFLQLFLDSEPNLSKWYVGIVSILDSSSSLPSILKSVDSTWGNSLTPCRRKFSWWTGNLTIKIHTKLKIHIFLFFLRKKSCFLFSASNKPPSMIFLRNRKLRVIMALATAKLKTYLNSLMITIARMDPITRTMMFIRSISLIFVSFILFPTS